MRRPLATTGRHDVVHMAPSDDQFDRFVTWWRSVSRTKRAPPPLEDDIDLLVYALLTVLFVLAAG